MAAHRCWAIIPARGGSKGIPRKNVRWVHGKPLLGWMIEAARAAQTVDRVIVSTDDDEIASVAAAFGAETVRRPDEISGGLSRSEDALLHTLDVLEQRGDPLPEVVAFLQCTSPLTTPDDIDQTVRMVLGGGHDCAMTATDFHYFVWRRRADGGFEGVNHDASHRLMRQEREHQYLEVGAVYALRCSTFRERKYRFFGRIGLHPIPADRTLEIDTFEDLALAESLLRRQYPPADAACAAAVAPLPWVSQLDLSGVRGVVFDFDGVMTDNRVTVDSAGVESVVCNRSDGWGVGCLRKAGVPVACVSSEANPVVARRCEKLKLPCHHGVADKVETLKALCREWGLDPAQVAYVGNDMNDAGCLRLAGIGIVPLDAQPAAAALADGRTRSAGGQGVVREIAEALLGHERME
jgi:YrbI family 3-deoxy-D-manno-octulosonate 8-phosphate phosphatase